MADDESCRDKPHQKGIENIEIPLVIAEIAVDPDHKFDESRDCSDQDDNAGDIDNAQEQPPVPLRRQWHPVKCFAQEKREANTCEHEKPKGNHLNCQSNQDDILARSLLGRRIRPSKHAPADDLNEESEYITPDEEWRDVS